MDDIRILELRARLLSAIGELSASIQCTLCGATIIGPGMTNHNEGCLLSIPSKLAAPMTPEKPPRLKPGPKPRGNSKKSKSKPKRADRSELAKSLPRENGRFVKREPDKSLGLPVRLGGLG